MDLRSFTVYDIFKRNARLFKNRTAIQSEDRRITFRELYDQVMCGDRLVGFPRGFAGEIGSPF